MRRDHLNPALEGAVKANDAGGEEVVLEDELQKRHVIETTKGSRT